jgi:NAD(P)-dependent dehydrogenase (short-subunit alcohol dehydrogenase family)
MLSHIITAKHAGKLMVRDRRGLIVEVTENHIVGQGGNPMAHTVKFGLKGMALSMAAELKAHGVAAVAITPGYLRSERMLEHYGVTEDNWRDGVKKDSNFLISETPLYVGRAVAALAADPGILKRTGQLLSSWDLAREYKFTDADGRRPDWGRHDIDYSQLPASLVELIRSGCELQIEWLDSISRRTSYFLKKMPKPARAKRKTKRS